MGAVAEVIAIGDELVHGVAIDTNSAHIARELEARGVEVRGFRVVSDDPGVLEEAIAACCAGADLVIATGGLGPTEDDRTRAAAAAAAGVELVFDEDSWRHIEQMFRRRDLTPPVSNRVQARLPAGARVLHNDWGTAPGFALLVGRALFCALPGVPREMAAMLDARVLPLVDERFAAAGVVVLHELRVVGLHEAEVGERLADLMAAGRNPHVGVTAHYGLHTVRLAAHAASEAAARALCEDTAAEVRPRLGEFLIYEGPGGLHERVGHRLIETATSIATAESCTGGLLTSQLTEVDGISAVLRGGIVSYSNQAKIDQLGVDPELLERCGAVSVEVAAAMAEGAARALRADLAVSITGVAGPGGGTEEKPVGTVCFGLWLRGETHSWRRRFPAIGRTFVRHRAAMEVLVAVLRALPR